MITYDHRDFGYSDKVDYETRPFDVMDLAKDAMASLTDRTDLLQHVEIPALIIHGQEDFLVDPLGGIQTARSLRDSELVIIPEMRHMLFNEEIKNSVEDHIIRFISSQQTHRIRES